MNNVLKQMLNKYEINNSNDEINAMKEIIQEIILCGLSRNNFFDEAAFYGGTALRIFYGLDRFSEDMDFSLLNPNPNFKLDKYFDGILSELNSYGIKADINTKSKSKESNIESAFIKGNTIQYIMLFFGDKNIIENDGLLKNIKIKIEVDINPPKYAEYEYKYQLLPSPYEVRLYDKASLFAGKIHAILCRNWSNRTKGRDLYDYVFYLSSNTKVNLKNLEAKLKESNYIDEKEDLTIDKLKNMLKEKFKEINYEDAKNDIKPFISDTKNIDIWSEDFFVSFLDKLESN